MNSYVAILRGINVSGYKKIAMNELKNALEAMEYTSVKTYIQSGNVVFQSEHTDAEVVSKEIAEKILKQFGFDIPVMVLTKEDLAKLTKENPFLKATGGPAPEGIHITFLENEAEPDKVAETQALNFDPDQFLINGTTIYVYCPNGYGRTKITTTFFESKLGVKATTRNWRTVMELIKMVNAL